MTDVAELTERLRHRVVIQKGEPVLIDMLDGHGLHKVSSGDVVQQRNPDGPEAASTIEALSERIAVPEGNLAQALDMVVDAVRDGTYSVSELNELRASLTPDLGTVDDCWFVWIDEAKAALEASHHAELVEALRQAVKTNPQEHWIELLTKIGEGQ